MVTDLWRFFIDVGGTFTDCVAISPLGEVHTVKVLSTAAVKGVAAEGSTAAMLVDARRRGEPDGFYRGYELAVLGTGGGVIESRSVRDFDGGRGAFVLDAPLASPAAGCNYEARSPEEAPLLAMRRILRLRLDEPVGRVDIRLGTTRGTNALLERRGPATAYVTTEGFADALRIGYQDRPKLFALAIVRPPPLAGRTVEVRERLAPDGSVLVPLDLEDAREKLRALRTDGFESLAVTLLYAFRNSEHEEAIGDAARGLGFRHVALSSRSAPVEKLVLRGDTTVVDAFLTPVVEEYVASIARSAPDARLRLLTSAGGLSAAASFRGKDSVLSGPAGGVVAVAGVAAAAGYPRAIGFDMGGTSTDVCRFDGKFDLEFECEKAGVRLAAPMLAIETVAAGGGSICRFDGERLLVGPESAGARPGPACYGAGGPLTITDVNLVLGRIPPWSFPFPLDRRAVDVRLDGVAAALAARGRPSSPLEAAAGFLEVANARMAAAIRKVSVARGADARDYVLVAFGGAGGQHACAVARQLEIREVLVPALAGLLSACGAGLAETRKFAEVAVLRPLDSAPRGELEAMFQRLENESLAAVLADGASAEEILPAERFLEMRYAGQDAALLVRAGPGDTSDWGAAFTAEHQRLYGYTHEGRTVEIVTARVECVARGRSARTLYPGALPQPRASEAPPAGWTAWFDGQAAAAAVVDVAALEPGRDLPGPAVLVAPFHTVVVEPGWEARRTACGDIVLRFRAGEARAARRSGAAGVDPVLLEVFHQHFAAIAEEMGAVLRRSALSTNVRERLDFSCAVFDGRGDLVANAPHVPVHLGAMGDCVKEVVRAVPDFGPDDVVVTNDPYRGGSHLPDVTVVTPVCGGPGEAVRFFVANRAHHAEIGGKRPGSMSPDTRSLAEEGVLIRNFRVVERGRPRLAELRRLLAGGAYPSRAPDENLADIEAQIAANRRGADLLGALACRHGAGLVAEYMRGIQDAAARLMEEAISKLPPGRREFADALDDGSVLRVALEVSGRRAAVDFTGTAGVLAGNLNATPAIVTSAVLYAFRTLIESDIPLNAGVLRPLSIIVPPSLLNPPAHADPALCAAVAGGNVETSQRLVDVLLGALGVVAASQGTMNNLLLGTSRFSYYETIGGGAGAGPDFAGASAVHTHMTNTRITDVEVLERRYPVRVRRFAVRAGSGGRGRHRGGDGIVREIELLAPMEVSILSQRRLRAPYGAGGGEPGQPGRNLLQRRGSDVWEDLPPIVNFAALAGDVLRIETPGGGGWGPP